MARMTGQDDGTVGANNGHIGLNSEKQNGGDGTDVSKGQHHPLFEVGVVGDGAQQWQEENLQQHRKGGSGGEDGGWLNGKPEDHERCAAGFG